MKDMPGEDSAYYASLTRKMMIVIIAVSLTPLILISALTRHYFQAAYSEKVISQLEERLLRHRQIIDDFLLERLGALRVQANSAQFEALLDSKVLQERLPLVQEEFGRSFEDLGIVNEQGVQVAYAGPHKLQGANYADAPWFKQAIQRDTFTSDVFTGLRGYPHIVIAVRREFEGKKWLLRASIDFEGFKTLVSSANMGSTGVGFIVNRDGKYQTSVPTHFTGSLEPFIRFARAKPVAGEPVQTMEQTDSSGVAYLYLMTRLKDGQWVLGYAQAADEAFSEMLTARKAAIAVFIIGSLAIILGAVFLSRRMVNHIAKVVKEKQVINEQLVEAGKLASLGEMAAGIAHEINNPVGIMVEEAGWMQDLLEDENLDEENLGEFKKSLHKIVTQGRRCKEITHKLLSFARKTDPTAKTSQLNELIQEVVGLSEQRARYSNVKIGVELQDDLPTVHVSQSEMQQVLLNMINNSMDALGNKGGTVNITSRKDGEFVVVDVADNGSGIPQEHLTKIFEPFFTTKPVGKGTGLGLSICYGILKKLGGDIRVDSEVGQGTTFHIYVPIQARKAQQAAS
jgi:two-component system NtrC family sensor kinase